MKGAGIEVVVFREIFSGNVLVNVSGNVSVNVFSGKFSGNVFWKC